MKCYFVQELRRTDWMFKLVGKEHFTVGKAKCSIVIEAVSGFNYEYSLEVNGKPLQKYSDAKSKIECCWRPTVDGVDTRVVLGNAFSVLMSHFMFLYLALNIFYASL